MKLRTLLLGSLSLGTLSAFSSATAAADTAQSTPLGLTYSVEGGLFLAPNYSPLAPGALDPVRNLRAAERTKVHGYRAALSLGQRIDHNWDITVGAAFNRGLTARQFLSNAGSGGAIESAFSFSTLDVGVGFTPVSDANSELRLFGGVRALYVHEQRHERLSLGSGGHTFTADGSSDFAGVGPRIGLAGRLRVPGTPIGVSGMAAGSAIYGRQSEKISSVDSRPGGDTPSEASSEDWRTVYDLEASLGVDLYLNDTTTFTLGYRAEDLIGLHDAGSGGSAQNLLVQGPFVKLSGSF